MSERATQKPSHSYADEDARSLSVPPRSGRRARAPRTSRAQRLAGWRRPRPTAVLTSALAATFLLLSGFILTCGTAPSGGWAPGSSDHISHWSSAVVFWYRGADIWREPMDRVCPGTPATPELAGIADGDTCTIPERGGRRPLVTNWRQFARPYPPLWVLWSAPEALLSENTTLPFTALNKLAVVKHLAAAHVLIFLLGLAWLVRPRQRHPGATVPATRAGVTATGVVSFVIGATEALRWSMLGYYDVAAIALVVAGLLLAERRRPGAALLAMAAAVALHFRALWYLPLSSVAAAGILGYGPWARSAPLAGPRRGAPSWRDWACAGAAAVLLGSSAVVLGMLRPTLALLPVTNILYRRLPDPGNAEHVAFLLPLALAVSLIVADRATLLLAALAWQLAFLVSTPQVMPWHSLFVLPLMVLARGDRRAEVAVVLVYLAEASLVFGTTPLSGDWISSIVLRLH